MRREPSVTDVADFLAGMAIASRRRARASARRLPESELRARIADLPVAPLLEPSAEGFDVLAEVKRRAPGPGAAGRPGAEADPRLPARLAAAYARGGAVAVSVLTEPLAFDGSLDDLAQASRTLDGEPHPIPTMRKDFLVDPYQLFEARAAGAGGALLIADLLEGGSGMPETAGADALLDAAATLGLWVLIEGFSDEGLDAAAALAQEASARGVECLVGVNVRDLRTLAVDGGRLARAAGRLPPGLRTVAESGMGSPDDVADAARLGYRFALIGRALSRSAEPEALLAEMIRAGRAARRRAVAS